MSRRTKQVEQFHHRDQLGRSLEVGVIVAFSPAWSQHVHIGRIQRITRSRVRIEWVHEYRSRSTGELNRYETTYQAHPDRTLILTGIEQELTVLSLKGLLR